MDFTGSLGRGNYAGVPDKIRRKNMGKNFWVRLISLNFAFAIHKLLDMGLNVFLYNACMFVFGLSLVIFVLSFESGECKKSKFWEENEKTKS